MSPEEYAENIKRLECALTALKTAQSLDAKGGPVRERRALNEREAARLWAAATVRALAEI